MTVEYFSSIPNLYPLDAENPPTQVMLIKNGFVYRLHFQVLYSLFFMTYFKEVQTLQMGVHNKSRST